MAQKENPDVGVIVGRFQVDNLHEGHIQFLDKIVGTHQRVIIFLGNSPCKCTMNNPLDFQARKLMFQDKYPDITVLYIPDVGDNKMWSARLDSQIGDIVGPNNSVRLYGSRDSFIRHYSGRYETEELEQEIFISGSVIRDKISKNVKSSAKFRAGAIWATANQYPKSIPTVDCIVYRYDGDQIKILLGKRNHENHYRIIGGFVSPGETWETTCRREVAEEAGVEINDPQYVKSFVIDDWRYRQEIDKITTTLFVAEIQFGRPNPGDDIDEVRWFDLEADTIEAVGKEHAKMLEYVYLQNILVKR